MFHRNRPRFLAVVIIIALILTITFAAVSVAVAQIIDPPPAPAPRHRWRTESPIQRPPRTMTTRPRPPGFGGGGGGGNNSGGGVPPPPTQHGLIKPVIYPWPPPNAIVLHAGHAYPAQPGRLRTARLLHQPRRHQQNRPLLRQLLHPRQSPTHGDPVTLYEGSNPGTGKPVTIDYLPAERLPPHQHLLRRPPAPRLQQTLRLHRRRRPQRKTPAMVKAHPKRLPPPTAAPPI